MALQLHCTIPVQFQHFQGGVGWLVSVTQCYSTLPRPPPPPTLTLTTTTATSKIVDASSKTCRNVSCIFAMMYYFKVDFQLLSKSNDSISAIQTENNLKCNTHEKCTANTFLKSIVTTNRTQPYKPLPLHTCTLTHKISNKFLCCVEKF